MQVFLQQQQGAQTGKKYNREALEAKSVWKKDSMSILESKRQLSQLFHSKESSLGQGQTHCETADGFPPMREY
jgi:hypothetical protein